MTNPLRSMNVVTETVREGLGVFDRGQRQSFVLNATSALVFQHCDGLTTPRQLAELLQKQFDVQQAQAEELVRLALEELESAHLLQPGTAPPPPAPAAFSRRAALTAFATAGLSLLLLPVVSRVAAAGGGRGDEDGGGGRQRHLSQGESRARSGYDVIVIGAGSSGSVLTGELVAAGASVLFLEAGSPTDAYPTIWDPNQINCLYNIPQIHWGYQSTPQVNLANRVLDEWRAKVMGGCTSHNDMVYTRGARGDFDQWANTYGCSGWDYDSVAPHFDAVEARLGPSTTQVNAFGQAFINACVDLGIPQNPNYNSGLSMRGVSLLQSTIEYKNRYQRPRRVTSFERYVQPLLDVPTPNLQVVGNALVSRVVIERGRATGVEYTVDGSLRTALASEVVLCAGSINSPKILMLSGVGNPKELARVRIPVVAESPAVGTNLQNAIIFIAIWKSARPIKDQPANEGCAIVWDNMIDDDQPMTCLEMTRGHYICAESSAGLEGFYGVTGGAMRLQSKGFVTLASQDPASAPIIDPRFLSAPGDYEQCSTAYDLMLKVGNAAGLADWRAEQIDPAPGTDPRGWLTQNIFSYSHPVGTCAMGSGADAVVDPQTLAVRGLSGLRVADVSIMPRITSGHTQGPAFMIGHKAAEMIRGAHSG